MEGLIRTINSDEFRSDLAEIEEFIQSNYDKLHFMWGIKNKLKIAAERLVRFHTWRANHFSKLYNTPLSSDVAYIINDSVINIDCKTVDFEGNKNDRKYIQFEPNQANFRNVPLKACEIPNVPDVYFEGYEFHPQLARMHGNKPVLSFFIFINYRDDGNSFNIEGTEICCLPHDEVVRQQFESNIIFGFKTYKYLKKMQAEKIGSNLIPTKNVRPNWIKFPVGATERYYDDSGPHPFDENKILIWGLESNYWNVCLGGHTTRVLKEKIKKRKTDSGHDWCGWEVVS